jgi:hypothetical protein
MRYGSGIRSRSPDVISRIPARVALTDVTVPPLRGVNVSRKSGTFSGSALYDALRLNPRRLTPLAPVSQFSQPA